MQLRRVTSVLAVRPLQRSTSSVTTAVPASPRARTGHTHVQTDPALVWEIAHGLGVSRHHDRQCFGA